MIASKEDVDSDLTLEIDGPLVTPAQFQNGVKSFFAILKEVASEVTPKPDAIKWGVGVRPGSLLVQMFAEQGSDRATVHQIASVIVGGITQITKEEKQPAYFNERALSSVLRLGKIVEDPSRLTVRMWGQGQPVAVTRRTLANVKSLLAGEHEDYGSVEGFLKAITIHKKQQFTLYDRLSEEAIHCEIPESLLEKALGAFGSRVEVYGRVRYRKNGKPNRVIVDEIKLFSKDASTSFRDVCGALRAEI